MAIPRHQGFDPGVPDKDSLPRSPWRPPSDVPREPIPRARVNAPSRTESREWGLATQGFRLDLYGEIPAE